ncbi:hypothetical protein KKG24_05730, partial [Patescibacteria group bacterium]|nr:hypothetical protein [Patescibacteria group bacterium]
MYVRTPILYRDSVEAAIYSQYPGAEINEALDYAKQFPQNAPNQDWDMWGTDYKLLKDDHHPIRTYRFFETEHEAKEEKRVDPVATLFEAMSKVKPTEQFWIQIIARPIADDPLMGMPLTAWVKKGEAIRDKLAKRPEKPKQKPII